MVPLSNHGIELIEFGGLKCLSRNSSGAGGRCIKVEVIGRRVQLVDDSVDESPKVARIVESCIEDLSGVGRQIDNSDLCKKNIENKR